MLIKLGKQETERFNILVVGPNNIGKDQFLQLLLNKYGITFDCSIKQCSSRKVTVNHTAAYRVETAECPLDIHIYNSQGFDDFIDNSNAIRDVAANLLKRHNDWKCVDAQNMSEAARLALDRRIHCLFYLMGANGMKEIDLAFIEDISDIVPVVPVIVKADYLSDSSKKEFQKVIEDNIRSVSLSRNIKWCCYDFYASRAYEPKKFSFVPQTSPELDTTAIKPPDAIAFNIVNGIDTNIIAESAFCLLPTDSSDYPTQSLFQPSTPGEGQDPDAFPLHYNFGRSLLLAEPVASTFTSENCSPNMNGPAVAEDPEKSNVFILVSEFIMPAGTHHSDIFRLQELVFESGIHIRKMKQETQRMSMDVKERQYEMEDEDERASISSTVVSSTLASLFGNIKMKLLASSEILPPLKYNLALLLVALLGKTVLKYIYGNADNVTACSIPLKVAINDSFSIPSAIPFDYTIGKESFMKCAAMLKNLTNSSDA
jgi:hypothetical protein